MLTLREIGASLGRIPRFCGHTRLYYPVLAHILAGSLLMEPKWAPYFVLHDATEASIGDIPTPWKCPEQKSLESGLFARICKHYGLPWPVPEDAAREVAKVDLICLYHEAVYLEHPQPEMIDGFDADAIDPGVIEIVRYHHDVAMMPMEGNPLPAFLNQKIAGIVYEEAFQSYVSSAIEAGLEGVDLEAAGVGDIGED